MKKTEFMFNPGDFVVYPTRGVGQIQDIKTESIGGQELDMIAINFNKDKATVKIPLSTVQNQQGLRSLSCSSTIDSAIDILQSKAKRTRKGQWVRRSQEYNEKIKSGDLLSLAEILRELYKDPDSNEQTYSERQVYEQALSLFIPEYAISQKLNEKQATTQITSLLQGSKKTKA